MSYKAYLIEEDGRTFVKRTKGYRPRNIVCNIPSSIAESDYPYLKYRTIPHPEMAEETINELYVDEAVKTTTQIQQTQEVEDEKWAKMRVQRDILLTQCDWTQLADCPLSSAEKAAYATYRQELRDLPSNTSDIDDITWPTKP